MNIASKLYANFWTRAAVAVLVGAFFLSGAEAARLKDIAEIKGVRDNILIGYGIVVGLKGTGDSSADVTSQSLGRLFDKLGLEVKNSAGIKSKNAAAVIVTSTLPAFARAGNKIDVTVSIVVFTSREGQVIEKRFNGGFGRKAHELDRVTGIF